MKKIILCFICAVICASCQKNNDEKKGSKNSADNCTATCEAKNSATMACKLSSPELLKRKETVLASLKKQVLEKKELPNGFAFRFDGKDKVLDELTEFIKTERTCCDFFTFNLSVSGDQREIWLEIKGENGSKEFIQTELGL